MGNYITVSDLEQRMSNGKFENMTQGRDDATVYANSVIDRSESVIDGFANKLYVTPLPASPMVQDWAMVISEYELYKNGAGGDVGLKYKSSYESVLALLESLSLGNLIPPNTSGDSLTGRNSNQGTSMDVVSDVSNFSEEAYYGSSYYIDCF